LLLELPDYRQRMAEAFAAGDYRRLRDSVHQILGAAAYCEAEELEQGLRQLRLALKTGSDTTIAHYYRRAIRAVDNTLARSGFRRQVE
jgi:HPt (histidine-containing phosphotransfer) domain-containing protein